MTNYLIVLYDVANMNPSERLHNQGIEQQVMTPELELSRQLRTKCEKLLQQKGENHIEFMLLLVAANPITLPLLALHQLDESKPLERLWGRYVTLRNGDSEKPNITIVCTGFNPGKAKYVDIYFSPMSRYSDYVLPVLQGKDSRLIKVHGVSLRLGKNRKGQITKPLGLQTQISRPATAENLSFYQKLVNQSSPIEHK